VTAPSASMFRQAILVDLRQDGTVLWAEGVGSKPGLKILSANRGNTPDTDYRINPPSMGIIVPVT
jgi:hypothetical protein